MKILTVLSFLCILAYAPGIANALTWYDSLLPGTKIEACQGQDVSFPWRARNNAGEEISTRSWQRNLENYKPINEVNRLQNNEARVFSNDSRFTFGPELQLKIAGATLDDTGNYTVTVNVTSRRGTAVIHRNSVSLLVKASPRLVGEYLQVKLASRAVLLTDGPNAGLWHVRLTCGAFQDIGHPAVSVLWTTPSGQPQHDSVLYNGVFFLDVPAAQFLTGRYSCQIHPQAKALDCVERNTSLWQASSVNVIVSPLEKRMAIVEGKMTALRLKLHQGTYKPDIRDKLHTLEAGWAQNKDICEIELSAIEATDDRMRNRLQALESKDTEMKNKLNTMQASLNAFINTFSSCLEARRVHFSTGVQTLCITGVCFQVLCEQINDGGGWTVFQYRKGGYENFSRNWQDYRNGFGDPNGEFWLGLDKIHLLTASGLTNLRVDVWKEESTMAFARYAYFHVDGPDQNFTLHVDNYWGDAGDSLRHGNVTYINGMPFSTFDRQNNGNDCATRWKSGWWFNHCFHANLNGLFHEGDYRVAWGDYSFQLVKARMAVR